MKKLMLKIKNKKKQYNNPIKIETCKLAESKSNS